MIRMRFYIRASWLIALAFGAATVCPYIDCDIPLPLDFDLVFEILMMIFGLPGFFVGGSITGNPHMPALVPMAAVNVLVYGTIGHLVLRRIERRQRRRKGLCLKCGYDLTGNVSGVCSECGEAR